MAAIRSGYAPLAGRYDEMTAGDGEVRPHWRPLLESLARIPPDEMARRVSEGRRAIRDNGMTFHVHQDEEESGDRPWPLDPIPLVLAAEEWARLEAGVAQRARLLNAILADVYGPGELLVSGALPPELLYANPGFLRPCAGLAPAGGLWLTVYCVDLARGADGRWTALGDRTEAPFGAGFALENRLVVNAMLPEAFEASGVRRLSGYFRAYRESLAALAPGHRENPRIAVMTAGPASDTYFENAFLARYLGYSLVEGSDLTVRGGRVYLKTLGGLLPVDLILRRQASETCDPLEFPHGGVSGCPGLLEAARSGSVAFANALGSGVLESPALGPYLPALCRRLLKEDLLLESAPTLWCGDEQARAEALARIGEMVFKPAFPDLRRDVRFGSRMDSAARAALEAEVRAHPYRWVAQQEIALSTAPVRTEGGLAPRFVVPRLFAVAGRDGYTVMPGGLARVSASLDSLDVTLLRGGSSKDIWVLGPIREEHVTLLASTRAPVDVSRATFDLPSRVAENLFWLGRYAERIDAAVRLVRATLPLLSEESTRRSTSALEGALSFLVELGYVSTPAPADGPWEPADILERELRTLVSDAGRVGGLAWQVGEMYRVGRLLRDRISADAWRIINLLRNDFDEGRAALSPWRGLVGLLDNVVVDLTAFSGAVMEGMTRGHGWRLLDMGRRLERGLQIAELLRHGLVSVAEDERSRIELLIETADSAITYRSRYLTSLQADLTIDLLLVDDANPRSIAFQLERLREHVDRLPDNPRATRRSPESRLVADAVAAVQLAELDEIAAVRRGKRLGLAALLDRVSGDLRRLSETLTRDYLTHAAPFRQLTRG